MSLTHARINALASIVQAESYLEIGVEEGLTFKAVSMSRKTGVDPTFHFDWQGYAEDTPEASLFNMDSDSFFASRQANDLRYDIVFIDGLHHYDQAFRDLQNSVQHSHDKTIYILDDTFPSDSFSCNRSQSAAIKLRAEFAGVQSNTWHGDTYKAIPLIALFMPGFRYATIVGPFNPQTVVWKCGDTLPADAFILDQALWAVNNLGACDYNWFLENLSLYNLASEADMLDAIREWASR